MQPWSRPAALLASLLTGLIAGLALAALLAFVVLGHGSPTADAASGHWQVKYASSAGKLSSAIAGIPAECRVEITQGANNDYYVAFGCPGD